MVMAKESERPFRPDWSVAPGEVLSETLEELGMDQSELARRMGVSPKHVSELIHAKATLTPEVAIKLDAATGVPASVWSGLESRYREFHARKERAASLGAGGHADWARRFPLQFLRSCGFVPENAKGGELVESLCNFFGVNSPDEWTRHYAKAEVCFRRSESFKCDLEATASWLRAAEVRAHAIETAPYGKSDFESALGQIRKLTTLAPDVYSVNMIALCRQAGVALVFVPPPEGCRASGAAKWLRDDKAMIALSARHKTDDHLWFSFFHEAGHIVAGDRQAVYLDGTGKSREDEAERNANRFAQESLIPAGKRTEMATLRTAGEIKRFAERIGVAPGIVVGQMQHAKMLSWTQFNHLKAGVHIVDGK